MVQQAEQLSLLRLETCMHGRAWPLYRSIATS